MMIRAATAVILVCIVAVVRALTQNEINAFMTTGETEQNTGLVGEVSVSEASNPSILLITSNNIPDHETGTFPVQSNPNSIEEQSYSFRIAKNPEANVESICLPMGPIAIATNGIVMYNPWDVDGENAVEGDGAEVFDLCDGHPDGQGRYHYHKQPASCLFDIDEGTPSPLVGVAFDGFPIYGPVDENGDLLTSADLDECHGRYVDGAYRYHTTADFPYILGCYRGTPKNVRIDSDNCHKASEADEHGNLPTDEPTTTVLTTTASPCRRPNSRRCLNGRKRRSANAQIPRNLFERKLLQNAIFGRRNGPQ